MMGGAKYMKLADNDVISLSNLNRIRYPLESIGENKAVYCAKQIYEINPYADLKIYKEGITEKNINEFLKKPKIDILIEEMDNPYLKVKIRFLARKLGIPVIMAADNGDGVIVDIERYDLNKNYPILHGILGKMTPEDFKSIPPKDVPRIIAKIAGANIADLRMLYSVTEVGKSIYSWPQLGNATTLCGSILTYLARSIILKDKKIKSGRYEVNPKEIFESGYKSVQEVRKRKLAREKFLKMLGLENK
jgi:molybdopterin/thiamine biosynthesis adenylyltransferase